MSGVSHQKDRPPRRRRTANFWEPIYDSGEKKGFPLHSWDFQHTQAPSHVTFTAEDLHSAVELGLRPRFDKIRFVKCDFSGSFNLSPREIVFNDCQFDNCDFGLSTWKHAKFSNCQIVRSSFSQSSWDECDFRSCAWDQIGISGNATNFVATTITNPGAFIRAAYTNLDEKTLSDRNTTPFYQKMRLESTKATVARILSRIYLNYGDERAYYDALKTASNQASRARIFESIHNLKTGTGLTKWRALPTLILHSCEWTILNAAGIINAWGRSVVRPAVLGAILIVAFAATYYVTGSPHDWKNALIKSAEITLLVGYTNHSAPTLAFGAHCLVLMNMIAGLFWYVVCIPTLINRVSRVR